MKKQREEEKIVRYYPLDASIPPQKCGVNISNCSTIWDLKEELSRLFSVPPQSLLIWLVLENVLHHEYKNYDQISEVRRTSLLTVYEVKSNFEDMPLHIRKDQRKPKDEVGYFRLVILATEIKNAHSNCSKSWIGAPFPISVAIPTTYQQLYNALLDYLTKRHYLEFPQGKEVNKTSIFEIHKYQDYRCSPLDSTSKTPLKLKDKDTMVIAFSEDILIQYYRGGREECENMEERPRLVMDMTSVGKFLDENRFTEALIQLLERSNWLTKAELMGSSTTSLVQKESYKPEEIRKNLDKLHQIQSKISDLELQNRVLLASLDLHNKMKELEREVERGSKGLCAICQLEPRNVVLLPCFHSQFCDSCADKVNGVCPLCRTKVVNIIKGIK
eukprot:TRINITY_DN2576_c0_g2_i1.p1 TRINITY_DN2576_c0_g2~~TRINITY_DN2576_c0_g2_i1.p1  ORF type:complete len:387 (-),score=76.07 TRINITY_DN2576_c0_g2_i1:723-1883(-)